MIGTNELRTQLSIAAVAIALFCGIANAEELSKRITTDGNPKAKGLSLQMDFPADWKLEEVALPEGYGDMERALAENLRVEISYATKDQSSGDGAYTTAERTSRTRVIRPRMVYSMRSKLYINAFCELTGEERTFRLDRIESWRLVD